MTAKAITCPPCQRLIITGWDDYGGAVKIETTPLAHHEELTQVLAGVRTFTISVNGDIHYRDRWRLQRPATAYPIHQCHTNPSEELPF